MDNDLAVGIDLGTTNSCIAVKENGVINVIPNSEGKRTTLSFVYYGKSDNVLVGKIAKHEAASQPSNGIYEIKRLLGCLHDDPDIERDKASLTYKIVRGTNGEIVIRVNKDSGERSIYPEEVCARILHKLKSDAESHLGRKIQKAVITVPAYFNNNQRAATRDAARIAGLEVIKLINEPSAAALAYNHNHTSTKEKTILIYDLGGGTFDVSIARTHGENITVLSVDGNTHLGGQDFLNRLVDYVVETIESKYKIEVKKNERLLWNIIGLCERTKKILTTASSTVLVPEIFPMSEPIRLTITRQKFEELNEDLFKQTIRVVDACLKKKRLDKEDIDEVLLVGGASRIPRLETLLKEYFNDKPIQRNINADEAIAVGAAIEAEHAIKQSMGSLVDVLPFSIGTVLDDQTIFFNFVKNTPLPATCKHNHVVKGIKRQARRCILSVYEGEDLDCNKNVLLGAHEIKWVKSTPKNRIIEITMQINSYGIIWVTARGDTIKTFSIVLNKGRLEEDEIVQMSQALQT